MRHRFFIGLFSFLFVLHLFPVSAFAQGASSAVKTLEFIQELANGSKIRIPGAGKLAIEGDKIVRVKLSPEWIRSEERYTTFETPDKTLLRVKLSDDGKIIPARNMNEMTKANGNSLKVTPTGLQRTAEVYKSALDPDGRSVILNFGKEMSSKGEIKDGQQVVVALPKSIDGKIVHYELDFSVEGMPRVTLWTYGKPPKKTIVPLQKMKLQTRVGTFESKPISIAQLMSELNAKAQDAKPLAPRVTTGAGFKTARTK
jgi:hypothetical protein